MTVKSARLARRGNVAVRLLAATALSSFCALPAHAQQTKPQDDTTALETIVVKTSRFLTKLGGKAKADTGTTVLGEDAMDIKAEGGDANSAIKNNANVQYQRDGSNDAGSDIQDLINTKPKLLSISGGKVWENNFMLNGIGINNITGTEEPFGNDFTSDLTAQEATPNINKVFGLHPQTVFVPSEFVSETTVIDSNAGARYGDFLGGVVDYKLKAPSTKKAGGSISAGFTTDELTTYNLRTEDRQNPNNVPKPEYAKYESAVQYNLPINESWALLGQYSRTAASGDKAKNAQYTGLAHDESYNETFRLASRHETDFGDFTLDGTYTNYNQTWDAPAYADVKMDVKTRSLATRLQWERDLEMLTYEALGLENVKLDANLFYNNSRTINAGGSNETYVWSLTQRSNTAYYTTKDAELLSICNIPASTLNPAWRGLTNCRVGGYGNKKQTQEDTGFKTDIEGDFLAGAFAAGLEYRRTNASRQAAEYHNYSATTRATGSTTYPCATNDTACKADQFFSTKIIVPAYNLNATVNHFTTYGELDQTWGMLNLRAGLRLDHEDFFDNLNIAPRTVATITPIEGYSIAAGYNRYYSADTLAYAVRDGQPLGLAYSRSLQTNPVRKLTDWTTSQTQRYYTFSGADVDTPYKDEYTLAVKAHDPWLDGELRIRFLERRGNDEFSTVSTGSNAISLTNTGKSMYRSLTAEYENEWRMQHSHLDSLNLLASLTWSKQKTTTKGMFHEEDENWAWYRGASYSPEDFDLVRGNLDIPIRTSFEVSSRWLDERLNVGFATNVNMSYQGVRSTERECTPSSATCTLPAGSAGIGRVHTIYNEFRYKPTVTVDFKAGYRVAQTGDNTFDVELNVYNLFNETGNKIASDDNPWVVGRTVWFGAKATF